MIQTAVKQKTRKQAVSGCFWATRTYWGRIKDDHKIDVACGSGGFLVAAFDRMPSTYKEMGIPLNLRGVAGRRFNRHRDLSNRTDPGDNSLGGRPWHCRKCPGREF